MKDVSTAHLDQIKLNLPEDEPNDINDKVSLDVSIFWSIEEQPCSSNIMSSITLGVSIHEKKKYFIYLFKI